LSAVSGEAWQVCRICSRSRTSPVSEENWRGYTNPVTCHWYHHSQSEGHRSAHPSLESASQPLHPNCRRLDLHGQLKAGPAAAVLTSHVRREKSSLRSSSLTDMITVSVGCEVRKSSRSESTAVNLVRWFLIPWKTAVNWYPRFRDSPINSPLTTRHRISRKRTPEYNQYCSITI
jgi:hypothetical protein